MAKKLQRVGNSFALVIDRPIRELLAIGPKTQLNLWTDGRRIIVEPLPDKLAPNTDDERLKLDAYEVANRLLRRYGMSFEQFAQLHYKKQHMLAYMTYAEGGFAEATADDLALMRRCEACLCARQDGKPWDEAIAIALQREPVTRRDSPKN